MPFGGGEGGLEKGIKRTTSSALETRLQLKDSKHTDSYCYTRYSLKSSSFNYLENAILIYPRCHGHRDVSRYPGAEHVRLPLSSLSSSFPYHHLPPLPFPLSTLSSHTTQPRSTQLIPPPLLHFLSPSQANTPPPQKWTRRLQRPILARPRSSDRPSSVPATLRRLV